MSFQDEASYLGKRVNLLEQQNHDLLEALQSALAQLREEAEPSQWTADNRQEVVKAVKAAIAKATNPNAGQAQAYPAGRWTGGGK
jgi:ABC-type nitrate/sulfonate/bicarbonate transport system ATPase subunit